MAFITFVAVLLIEQIRPLPYAWLVLQPLSRFADRLEVTFNAGEHRYGVLAWLAGVGGLTLLVALIYAALYGLSPVLGWLWTVFVLYLTLGFRRFSHYFSDIQFALRMDDLAHARALLTQWTGRPAAALSPAQIARLAIEEALGAAHHHVFGVLLCFVVLPGPCGAVLYRVAAFLAERWGGRGEVEGDAFGDFARRAFALIDWLPARLTAASFAVVGNFEDAVYGWRTQADRWPPGGLGGGVGIVLASAAGALGVRLGDDSVPLDADEASDGVRNGSVADVDTMQSTVGLLWRALLLCLMLLLLVGLAGLVS